MLRDLHIRNLAVLEEAAIDFADGLNILSGETGAGKSIVVDSLTLLAGVRASTDMIRTGADTLTVTGVFEPHGGAWRATLAEAGIDDEGILIIRREISKNGRNRVFVNDHPVTLRLLTDLAPDILRIHGQREELGLVDPDLQRAWLDRSGGKEAAALLAKVAAAHGRWQELAERLDRLTGDDRARQERIDLLRFQVGEIDDARPLAGEEDELRAERDVLRNAGAIGQGLSEAMELLFEGEAPAYDALNQARHALEEIAVWETSAAEHVAELEDLGIRLNELERTLGRRRDEVEADPARLDAVEDRLAVLERLLRKYGSSTAEILEYRAASAAELDELEGDDDANAALASEVEKALAAYRDAALELSKARAGWAEKLVRRTREHLRDLALEKARIEIRLERRPLASSPLQLDGRAVDFHPNGIDHVVYLFSPNPGEEVRPLAKVASGGELSRLYLGVQLAAGAPPEVGDAAAVPTLVFDEVDAGISGAEAAKLGGKLRELGSGRQILAVTHLPQVASCANVHFKVSKVVQKGRTRTEVRRLAEDGRIEEVARMLAGSEVTELSLSHARELIVAGAEE